MLEKPCAWHVYTYEGDAQYCEAGPEGHKGSHIGERSGAEYVRLLEAWIAANSTGEGAEAGL